MTLSAEVAWTKLSDELRAFFRRRVRDEHRAEDLLQETFVRVHDGLGGLEDEEKLSAWVRRVARNVLVDERRAASTGPLEEEPADEEPEASDERNWNAEVDRWLVEMLPRLPDDYREAVALAELEGLTQREVAARLGLSLSGAKSRVQRGRQMLRSVLLACCHLDFDRRGNVVGVHRRRGCERCESR